MVERVVAASKLWNNYGDAFRAMYRLYIILHILHAANLAMPMVAPSGEWQYNGDMVK